MVKSITILGNRSKTTRIVATAFTSYRNPALSLIGESSETSVMFIPSLSGWWDASSSHLCVHWIEATPSREFFTVNNKIIESYNILSWKRPTRILSNSWLHVRSSTVQIIILRALSEFPWNPEAWCRDCCPGQPAPCPPLSGDEPFPHTHVTLFRCISLGPVTRESRSVPARPLSWLSHDSWLWM